MVIGVPKEIKDNEYRVALVPSGVRALKGHGHRVLVEEGAGAGSAMPDREYEEAGAEVVASPGEVFSRSDVVIKVKEPQPEEYACLREGLILFTFLHLAAKRELTDVLIDKKVTTIAYETVEAGGCGLPILRPMSEVAGKLSVQIGAHFLLKANGGRGVLLGGIPGVERGAVLILGAGTVGLNALKVAVGLGAEVCVIDVSTDRFRYIDDIFGGRVKTLVSNAYNIEKAATACDMLIGAVHVPGARTPVLVPEKLVRCMKKGSVIVDVAVDQGGCVETIRPTTHSQPVYEVAGVLHYGVSNIPGAVPRTSTFALSNVTLPYLLKIADLGLEGAVKAEPALARGTNTLGGKLCHRAVAEALGVEYTPLEEIL